MKFTVDDFREKLPLAANDKWPDGVGILNRLKERCDAGVFAPRFCRPSNRHAGMNFTLSLAELAFCDRRLRGKRL